MSEALGRIEGMDLLAQHLEDLRSQALAVLRVADAERAFERASEGELALQLGAIAEIGRLTEALLIDAVGEVARRSGAAVRDDRMTSHLGCRDVVELVQQITRVAPHTAARLQRAALTVRPEISDTTGEKLAAPFPSVRAAMLDGVVGADGILAITGPLQATAPRVPASARAEAAEIVVAEARGEGPGGAPPACAELLKIHAQTWALALDPDGAEPRERVAERKRALILGVATPAGVPVRGHLVPEVAAQLQLIFDAHQAPTVVFTDPYAEADDATDAPLDLRTRAQKQHDAFAAALGVAASSGLLPTIGGYAPTLVVSVDAADMASGTGYAHLQGCDQPISIAVARHIACSGTIQRITSRDDGRHRRAHLQPLPAPRDRAARRRVHHSGLRSAGRVVRDPPRHRVRPRRSDAYGQRRDALLVSPPLPRTDRLEDPHEWRRARGAGTRLVRHLIAVAKDDDLAGEAQEAGAADVSARGRGSSRGNAIAVCSSLPPQVPDFRDPGCGPVDNGFPACVAVNLGA